MQKSDYFPQKKFADEQHPFGTLGNEVEYAIRNDYDVKIIITSHNSKPGLGKTTLAIRMSRVFDPHGWNARDKGFQDLYSYQEAYRDVPPGSVLQFEELEQSADNRRSMSRGNVDLSHVWATERFRNVVTICTLPTVSMLDNRMLELSDYWINVMRRGVAHPYRVLVNDFNGKIIRNRINDETIRFEDLPEGDDDYEYLKQVKKEQSTLQREYYRQDEVDKKIEQAKLKKYHKTRNEFINTLREYGMTYDEIGNLECVDLSKQRVGEIIRG